MHPVLFEIGEFTAYTYGLLMGIAIVTAIIMSYLRAEGKGLDKEAIFDIAIWGVIFGFVGAKGLYLITIVPELIKDPSLIKNSITTGFVVYGGIIGGVLAAYIYCGRKKLPFMRYFDLVAPAIAVAQGIGRIGCFMSGCCYGNETTSVLGVVFKNSQIAPNGVKLHPTQIYSSIGDFLIAGILIYFSSKPRKRGQTSGLYMILYSIGRFLIEFLRNDLRGNVGFLSTSQFICIFVLLSGIIIYNMEKFLFKKTTTPPSI